jgi:hypothetical protein
MVSGIRPALIGTGWKNASSLVQRWGAVQDEVPLIGSRGNDEQAYRRRGGHHQPSRSCDRYRDDHRLAKRFAAACAHDRPPLKWSDLRYVFDIQEDCNGKEAIQA